MDYKRMLMTYMVHVCYQEGTPFANDHDKRELLEHGLTAAEADEIIRLAGLAYERYKQEVMPNGQS